MKRLSFPVLSAIQDSRLVRLLVIFFLTASITLLYQRITILAHYGGGLSMDFGVFHLVGDMVWHGNLKLAYSIPRLMGLEHRISGDPRLFMPWSYPPQYNFLVALVALLPLIPSFVVFTLTTYLTYLAVLWRVARSHFGLAYIVIFPTVAIEITCGQNGFITGALTGWFVLAFLRNSALAGIPLGLMAIKPHLAVAIVFLTFLKRRWGVIGVAAVTVAASFIAATLAFGTGIWPAFFQSIHDAGSNLALGAYPMARMTSVLATLTTLGAGGHLAIAAQVLSALIALWVVLRGHLRGLPSEAALGLACIATLAISPYNYDYDLPIFGIGLALILPRLLATAAAYELAAMFVLYWVAAGTGFYTLLGPVRHDALPPASGQSHHAITFAGFAYLAVVLMSHHILTRTERRTAPSAAPS